MLKNVYSINADTCKFNAFLVKCNKFSITPQAMLVVAPAIAAVPSVLSVQVKVDGHAAKRPHMHVAPVQTLELVPVQAAPVPHVHAPLLQPSLVGAPQVRAIHGSVNIVFLGIVF